MPLPPLDAPLFAAAATGGVARVALPVPADELFDYAVPPSLDAAARPGCRVRVRLGARTLVGIIAERAAEARFAGRLRPLEAVLDAEPALPPSLLAILREEAAEILCPVGLALAAAPPAGSTPRLLRGWSLTPRGREALAQGAVGASDRRILERLAAQPLAAGALRRHAIDAAALRRLERERLVALELREARAAAAPRLERVARVAPGVDAEAAAAGPLARSPARAALLRELAAQGEAPARALAARSRGGAAALRALAALGLVAVSEREAPEAAGPAVPRDVPPALTEDQAKALEPIVDAVRAREPARFLLHGVTGSGKTEVYLRAVAAALGAGRRAIVLVPEISLTHQIVLRMRARFGDAVAVLHSGLRPRERLAQWRELREGGKRIAVGARSALFAPFDDVGVLVIDEEHDGAYKNDEGFRYHARDLATRRAAHARCPLVLGSATPALETRFAADRGELRRLVLPSRIGARPLPAVEIVDLEQERRFLPRGRKLVFSRALSRALAENLARGGQAILLLNRRGFSTRILCWACGHAERCEHCDVSLVFHASDELLHCHYCDLRRAAPAACAGCGASDAALLGIGTERVEEALRSLLPRARIARLDRDTAARRGFTERVLRELQDGALDVVVGTQMLAKGHDFPGVRLVGVVLADVGLHLPDFRAAERTFQLLTQVAGRAGRDAQPGRVVIQTFVPNHYAIRPVREHDYEAFYAEELGHRAPLGYPPFGHLAHLVVSGPDEAETAAAADGLAAAARAAAAPGVEVLGPAPAPLARLRGRHRHQVLLKGPDRSAVREAARALAAAAARLPAALQASVDLRPYNML
jgi:primosomal protein N' (replication factor Y)